MRSSAIVGAGLLCALSAGVSAAPAPDGPEFRLVEMVVARVDTTVITLSELVAETRLVLLRTHGPERARSVELTDDLLRAVLRAMTARELLLAEARRLQLREVPEAEVEAAAREVRRRFATPGDYVRFLERVGFTVPRRGLGRGSWVAAPPVLAAILRAERQVERFIALRIHQGIVVHDDDVRRCYEANARRFARQPLGRVAPIIERTIRREQAERSFRSLVEQLERKAEIHYAPGFVPDPDPEDDEASSVGLRCAQ